MTRKNAFLSRFIVLILLLALPALACTTLTGDGDEDATTSDTGNVEQSAAASSGEPAPASGASTGEESITAGDQENVQNNDNAGATNEGGGDSTKSGGDPRESIFEALRSSQEVDAMRLRVTTEDITNGVVSEVTLAFVRPGRYQMVSDGAEFIIIDDTTYMNSGDGSWITLQGTDMTSTVESTLDAFAGSAVIESRQDSLSEEDVHFEGKESINGVDTLVYSFGTAIDGSVKMWIGEDDGLLYRQEVKSNLAGQESRILMEFEYGSDVTIEAPE